MTDEIDRAAISSFGMSSYIFQNQCFSSLFSLVISPVAAGLLRLGGLGCGVSLYINNFYKHGP